MKLGLGTQITKNRPSGGGAPALPLYSEAIMPASANAFVEWDVTAHVKDAIANSLANVDLLLRVISPDEGANRPRFYTKEHGTANQRPILTVDAVNRTNQKDTMLTKTTPTTVAGGYTNMHVGPPAGADGERNILISFDVPASCTVATLKLYIYQTYNGSVVAAYKCTRPDWVEAQAHWNIYKTANNWTTAGGDYTT